MRLFRVFCAAVAFAALVPLAHAERYLATYEGSAYGVLPIGRATLTLGVRDGRYDASAMIRSSGLAALFDRTMLRARSQGRTTDAGVAWERFELDHSYARKRRVTDMQPAAGDVVALITPPHRDPEEIRPSPSQKAEARDPLASLAAMAVRVAETGDCAGRYPTFDGRFRYDLILRVEGRDRHVGGGYDGPALKCKIRFVPVAGYRTARDMQRRIPEGEIWFALAAGDAVATPLRITAPLPLGWAGVRLSSLKRAEVSAVSSEPASTASP